MVIGLHNSLVMNLNPIVDFLKIISNLAILTFIFVLYNCCIYNNRFLSDDSSLYIITRA